MNSPTPTRRVPPAEEGYILLWVIFLLVIFTIGLSVAVPRMMSEIQLDRERETMKRGQQYIRAVQLYYRKFHAYPPNADALVKTQEIRFLRRKYIDPVTGKDDWKPILFGQAKTPTLGFFGQPVAGAGSAGGSALAGIGPSGGNTNSTLGGTGSTIGSSSILSSSDSTATGSTPGSTTSTGTSSTSGQTFGGAGIIGFSPASPKASILLFKKKSHYNDWEFIYDPLTDVKTQAGGGGGTGKPVTDTSTPIGGTPTSTPMGTPSSSPGP